MASKQTSVQHCKQFMDEGRDDGKTRDGSAVRRLPLQQRNTHRDMPLSGNLADIRRTP
jgi:hypothetical protein